MGYNKEYENESFEFSNTLNIHEKRSVYFQFLEYFYNWTASKSKSLFEPSSKIKLLHLPNLLQRFPPKSCTELCQLGFLKSNPDRYVHLKKNRYLFALNLYNNDQILPDLLASLLFVFSHLNSSKIHVSVFENGSADYTTPLLEAAASIFHELRINHTIRLNEEEAPYWVHRIKYMAELRNKALEVLWKTAPELRKDGSNAIIGRYNENGSEIMDSLHLNNNFDKIVFLNDILFCPDQFLELLHQSELNDAHFTCGMDYDGNSIPLACFLFY
ncbi:capsular associated protein [Coelomomyces lativittatus]|nr:capsular associated protein [Coelomomyces lativittatus]KAJ1510571.1 capsular associated protein [Coelomomyces lativittatus]